jgi:hypothetical protein
MKSASCASGLLEWSSRATVFLVLTGPLLLVSCHLKTVGTQASLSNSTTLLSVIVAASTFLLDGCATVCHDARIVQMTPVSLSPGVQVKPTQPFAAMFALEPKVQVTLSPCRDLDHFHGSICFHVRAEERRRLRLSSAEFLFRREGLATSSYRSGPATYTLVCKSSADGSRQCTSSETPPTSEPVAIRIKRSFSYQGNMYEVKEYSFDPTFEFRGAAAREGPSGLRAFIESENWREYTIIVVDGSVLESPPGILHIPSIWIDGAEFRLPDIRLATTTGPVCTVRQVM